MLYAVKPAKKSSAKKDDALSEIFKQRKMDLWQMAHAVEFCVNTIAEHQKIMKESENKFKSLMSGLPKSDYGEVQKIFKAYPKAKSLLKYVK